MLRSAICAMVRDPSNLYFWIYHHLHTIHIDYIFLRLESDQFIPFPLPPNVIVLEHEKSIDSFNSILHQQQRQIDFVNRCLHFYSSTYSIQYLIHIDDDELIMLHSKYHSLSDIIQLYFREPYTHLRIQNFEAIFYKSPHNHSSPFFQTFYGKDCSIEKARSYSNGKSIAYISPYIYSTGPHTFSGQSLSVSKKDMVIFHYDSILFSSYLSKFQHLSSISDNVLDKIPFRFYQQSIQLIKNPSTQESDLYDFWFTHLSDVRYPIYMPNFYHFPYDLNLNLDSIQL